MTTTKLRMLRRENDVASLENDCFENRDRYKQDTPWLEEVLPSKWEKEYRDVEVPSDWTLVVPQSEKDSAITDTENTKIVYKVLKGLTPTQAIDPRIWVYLTHVQFWSYMRKRWSFDDYSENSHTDANTRSWIRERYHFRGGARAMFRNGISRLFWFGHASYDETRANPWELTDVLVSKQDILETLFGRNPGRNRTYMRAFLTVVQQEEEDGALSKLQPKDRRNAIRELAKDTTFLAGVTAIDFLDFSELVDLLTKVIQENAAKESDKVKT